MAEETTAATPKGTWRESLNISLQVVILAVSLFLGIDAWLGNRLDDRREAFARNCRQTVERLAIRTDPQLFTLTRLRPFFRPWPGPSLPRLRDRVESLKRRSGLDLLVFTYDPQGELTGSFPAGAPNLWVMKLLFKGLTSSSGSEFDDLRLKLDKKIPFVFGYGKDLTILRRDRGLAIDTFNRAERGVLLWQAWDRGGVILHCPLIPTEEQVFDTVLRAQPASRVPAVAGFGRRATDTWKRAGATDDPQARRAWADLQRDQHQEGLVDGTWWTFLETTTGRTVYAAFPPPVDPLHQLRRIVHGVGGAGLVAALLVILGAGLGAAFTLRRILLGLFLAAALIPLLGLAIGSFDVVQVFQAVLGTRIQAVQDEAIRNLVQEFDGFLASCSVQVRRTAADPGILASEEGWQRFSRRLRDQHLADLLQLRDAGARLLFSSDHGAAGDREVMVRAMCRRAIERFQPDRLDDASYTPNVFADAMVRRDDMGFSTILNHQARFQTMEMGSARFLYYFQVLPAATGQVAFFDVIVSLSRLASHYLRLRQGRRLTFDGVWHRFFALRIPDLHWTLPPTPALRADITHLALTSWLTGRPTSLRLESRTRSGFAVAIPCPELADHSLVAFYPDDLVRERIDTVWQKILLGALFFVGLIGLMAHGISRQFLAPLGHLEEAVAALGRRQFEFRLPVAGEDEMARLFGAFNDMMVDSKDLQVARTVQEGLVPQTFPILPGYSVHGVLMTASDLGGDCLDCFSLAGDRTIFLIGDITGHGVGSALLMAFSRAITFHWSQGQTLYPVSLTTDLDRMLRRRHGSRLFMGVICGILDSASHQLDLVVRGHVYPLLLTESGAARWIGSPSYPLGIGTNQREPDSLRLPIHPGDRLLCLTDGFIEARRPDGEMVGYERVAEWARAERQETAQAWLAALLARHQAFCGHRLEDDLTMFAIVRQPGGDR
ncbi:MAG: SpoIIE family protein phosphatase [Candidatus Riflebacteria bacterium]|nr:SpoIIE family protein phosphatase [Candidatus Riflebacteria bacterium]